MSQDRDSPFAALETAVANQVAEENAGRLISSARARLILGRDAKSVFFATLALRLQPQIRWDVETVATDGKTLAINPDFVSSLCPDEVLGVLAHEVMHNALAHPLRRGPRDPDQWNIACDLAINPLLRDAGFVLPKSRLMPGEGRFQHLQPGKSAEEYYAALQEPAPDSQTDPADNESDDHPPRADGGRDPGGCGSVLTASLSPADSRQLEGEWKVAIAQAKQASSQRGELPGALARLVHDSIHPPADWRTVLGEFLSCHARNDYSWARPNRRLLGQGLYLPGMYSRELGDVVLAVDTSGSIDEELLGRFAAEINAILANFDCALTVLYHDSEVQKVQTWQSSDGPLKLEPEGGGGTSHVCVFDWLAESAIHPACVICLTDLETEFPVFDSHLPVLWAVPAKTGVTPPFGRTVVLAS